MNNKDQENRNEQGAGSSYNKNHAGHLPDYGGNDIDPNATEVVSEQNQDQE